MMGLHLTRVTGTFVADPSPLAGVKVSLTAERSL